jgi:hypothetical protein
MSDERSASAAARACISLLLATAMVVAGGPLVSVAGGEVRLHPGTGVARAEAPAAIPTTTPDPAMWVTNLPVRAIAPAPDGSVYIGGGFTRVGPTAGGAGVVRNHLARILPDGSVDPKWDPNVNDWVHAIVVSGTTVYVGGDFTKVNGSIVRNHLAAFDVAADRRGGATSWDPHVNNLPSGSGQVFALALSGSTVYAGGQFTSVNGSVPRNNLAAFDVAADPTGTATPWDPNIRDESAGDLVYSIVTTGSTVYAAGSFYTVNGSTTRHNLAAFDTATSTGTVTAWNPDLFDNPPPGQLGGRTWVHALAISGSTLYAGGNFATANGSTPRSNLASFDLSAGGALTSWNPNVGQYDAFALAASGSTVWVGGRFSAVNGGTPRNHLAAFDTAASPEGLATAWAPDPNGEVDCLACSGPALYAGGNFDAIGGASKKDLARFWLADVPAGFDKVPPLTTLSADPASPDGGQGWYTTHPTITLSTNEPATSYCSWDFGPYQPYTTRLTASEGIHTLSYYSIDSSGNTETASSATFKVAEPSRLSRPSCPTTVRRGKAFTVWGTTRPRLAGSTRLYFSHKLGTRWVSYGSLWAANRPVLVNGSRYARKLRLPWTGRWYVRAYFSGTPGVAPCSSACRYFVVR